MTALKSPTPVDARGKPCSIAGLSSAQIARGAIGADALYDEQTRREVAITEKLGLVIALAAGAISAVLWQIVHMVCPLFGLPGLFAGFIILPTATAYLTWRLTLGAVRRRCFRRLSSMYLSTGRCPACHDSLAALNIEPDGCTVCPECGAAWRALRIGTNAARTDSFHL
jgi:hypothetical protein